MKKIFLVLLISFFSASISAQVKFEAQVERDTYGLNERFPLAFSINNEGDNFQAPKITGFKAEGPFINKGNQTSITIVNGRMTQKREISTQVIYYLTPTKKGPLGTRELNKALQNVLNPNIDELPEKANGGAIFRVGDRIMQIKNNYCRI